MKRILAVDPGSSKCGTAVLEYEDGAISVCTRTVVSVKEALKAWLSDVSVKYKLDYVVIGSGTCCNDIVKIITETLTGVPIVRIDEANTTMMARKLYWQYNPPKGWRKLLPLSLQVPPEPYDDMVAILLGERYLKQEHI